MLGCWKNSTGFCELDAFSGKGVFFFFGFLGLGLG